MKNWAILKNQRRIESGKIPCVDFSAMRKDALGLIAKGRRVVSFFARSSKDGLKAYMVFADDDHSSILVSSSDMSSLKSFESLTKEAPAFNVFERGICEEHGIIPEGHPWLKPVRYPYYRFDKTSKMEDYPFFKITGEEVHEVGVGPVHAGVIEPGHFRFQCTGELVHHLEIQLGYQHRGVEKLMIENKNPVYRLNLSESICGDSLMAHASAHTRLLEALSGSSVSVKAMSVRAVGFELERIGVHLGDLSALCNDAAYLLGSSVFGALRTLVINTLLRISGSRFGKGLFRYGGVNYDIDKELAADIRKTLLEALGDTDRMCETLFSSASALSRFEHTGTVSRETAQSIGMVGMAARASGLALDVRADHPWGAYKHFPVYKVTLDKGDVFSRAYIRCLEIRQSIKFILEQLEAFSVEALINRDINNPEPSSFAVSMTEGWRGETVHIGMTDEKGGLCLYKVKDPSVNNWLALALAVRNNEISDFPLCNKSFNLSYCGHDL